MKKSWKISTRSTLSVLLLLLFWSGSALAANHLQSPDYVQNYWGSNIHPPTIFGEILDDPVFILDNEAFALDVDSIPPDEYWGGCGLYFIADPDRPNITDATVTLDSGSVFEVIAPPDDELSTLTGISIMNFDEAHVSLLGASQLTVNGAGQYITTTGFYLQRMMKFATAEIFIDEGSTVQVTATAANTNTSNYANATAYGAYLHDDVHDKVTISNGSTMNVAAAVNVDASDSDSSSATATSTGVFAEYAELVEIAINGESTLNVTAAANVTANVDSSSAEAESIGIDVSYAELVEITLDGESTLNATATATSNIDGDVDGYTGATSVGIEAYGDTVKVSLLNSSSVMAKATSVEDAISTGIDVTYNDNEPAIDHGEVTLDGASSVSSIATATGDYGYAESTGVAISAEGNETAILTLNNKSTIYTEADGADAYAIGSILSESTHVVADIKAGSSIEAKATSSVTSAVEDITANASANGLLAVDVGGVDEGKDAIELTLDDASITSIISATAIQTGSGDARAENGDMEFINGGILVMDYQSAAINLKDTTISVTAEATAEAQDGSSIALIGVGEDDEMMMMSLSGLTALGGGATLISLTGSSIDVAATATADESNAWAAGIQLVETPGDKDETTPVISLVNSSIKVSATAIGADEYSMAVAAGIWAWGNDNVNTINLDNSTIKVTSTGFDSYPLGIYVVGDDDDDKYTINLENNSSIQAVQKGDSAEGISAAIAVADAATEINVSTTSSLIGDWAVIDWGRDNGDSTLNNNGLVAGRLAIDTLNNSATGVLQSTFGLDDTELAEDGIRYFEDFNGGEGGAEFTAYYFTANNVTLADGTTFRIVSNDNFGLSAVGDVQRYALLDPPGEVEKASEWNQDKLNLTSSANSPMLGLSWDAASDAHHLIARATFLTPTQAGLTNNGTAAFNAAMADGVFDFGSDPEQWVPNVSGAFVAGMTHTLGTSNFNVGRRLGTLMGMNSGDEIIASNGMWLSARFTEADQDKRDGIVGFDADNNGLTIGFDREFANVVLGFAYTRGDTDADADDNSAKFDMTDNMFSLYANYDGGNWYTDVILSAGFGSVDGMRYVGSDAYESDYDSTSYNAKAEAGMKFNQQGVQVAPFITMQYSTKDYDSYTESGSGAQALHVKSQDYEVFTMGAGAVADYDIKFDGCTVTPEVSAAVNYDITNDRIVSTANFVGGSSSFVAKGIEPSETSWDLGAALTIASLEEQNVSLRLGYDYSGRQDFDAHSVTGKLRFEF